MACLALYPNTNISVHQEEGTYSLQSEPVSYCEYCDQLQKPCFRTVVSVSNTMLYVTMQQGSESIFGEFRLCVMNLFLVNFGCASWRKNRVKFKFIFEEKIRSKRLSPHTKRPTQRLTQNSRLLERSRRQKLKALDFPSLKAILRLNALMKTKKT